MVNSVIRRMARLGHDRRGSVTVICAFVLPVLIGVVALVAEFGHGLLVRSENQRVADLAAYAGAMAYGASGSTATMNAAIANVAVLNGLPSTAITGTVTSASGGNQVTASVSTSQLLLLAPVLGGRSSLSIASSASAQVAAQASGCVIALSGTGTGVTLSGGTSLTTATCAVSSNTSLAVPCGTTITTQAVTYNTSAPTQGCNGIKSPSGGSASISKSVTPDPLSGNSGVTAATGRLSTVSGYSNPTIPTVPTGTNLTFDYGNSAVSAAASAGCTAAFASPTWTVTCPGNGTYKFGAVSLGGGITVNFNTGGSAGATYDFSGTVKSNGTALNFGPGTFNMAGGLETGGGSTTTFKAGTFNIGLDSSCGYSICNTSTLTFAGPSTFVLTAGISNSGGSTLTMGSGTTNSYQIGSGSSGNSFYLGGGSITQLADATGASGLFTVVGNVNVTSGGGSCFQIPAAAQHDIKGFLSTAGGTVLGSGPYTATGYVALGANGGGDVTCWGSTVGLSGTGVTLTIGASTTPSGGSCSGQAFCSAAGYGHVTLTAPTSGTLANLVVLGPISTSNTAGATFTEGSSNTSLSGAFYFPNGPITMGGGSSVGSGSGQCLEFIGSQITLSGGTALASTCIGSTSGPSTAHLVQ